MTRIDFHTNIDDKLSYACRLARKAHGAGARLVLLAEDADQAQALDQALWNVGPTDFLAHAMAGAPLSAHSPIIITTTMLAELPHSQMLINLSRSIPAELERFERVFEIISSAPDDAQAGRARYSSYKQQAYPLTHFVAGNS
jgi:DNA polymerase-3 subunit chi